ncbi:MAG: hypothetical protein [Caudoviricetes sp.]|nr:MAG: hypothetical protein [Caudoviricetes sp.]
MNINEVEYILCWSCDFVVSIRDLNCNDGFRPYCKQEIEL